LYLAAKVVNIQSTSNKKGFTMKLNLANRIFVIFFLVVAAGVSHSQSLSQSVIDKYMDSIEMFMTTDDPEIKSIEESFKNNQNFSFDTDEDGNIRIMSQMLEKLESSQVDALSDVIEDAGFDSVKEWAAVGDRVSAAIMAIEMENEPVDVSEMTPEMLAMVPESMRKQIEGVMRVMKAVEKVPADDIKIVKANYAGLKKYMDGNTQ
jgi:hypothetical protein